MLIENGNFSQKNLHIDKIPCETILGDSNKLTVMLWGNPILRGNRNIIVAARFLAENGVSEQTLSQLNGCFSGVALNSSTDTVYCFNDRFCYYPVYFSHDNADVKISDSLFELVRTRENISFNENSIYEFIHFQRIFAEHTFVQGVQCLARASLATYHRKTNKLEIKYYWHPNYSKQIVSRNKAITRLAELTEHAFSEYTSEEQRYGLLLSGGLDSRLVLAAKNKPLTCFSIGSSINNEVKVAQKAADIAGCKHLYVSRCDDHYDNHITQNHQYNEGINTFNNGHFFGFSQDIQPKVDTLLHGHGFDVFFQAMYMPKIRVKLLSHLTYFFKAYPFSSSPISDFIREARIRTKPQGPSKLIYPHYKGQLDETLTHSLTALWHRGKNYTDEENNLWESMIHHNLGRHTTHLNLLGMQSYVNEVTLCFHNDLLDLYFSLPPKLRLHGNLMAGAIKKLNPALARLVNANTNHKMTYGPLRLTSSIIVKTIASKLGMNASLPPGTGQRSWPTSQEILLGNRKIFQRLSHLAQSKNLAQLKWLDLNKLEKLCSDPLSCDAKPYHSLLFSLLTLDECLDNLVGDK